MTYLISYVIFSNNTWGWFYKLPHDELKEDYFILVWGKLTLLFYMEKTIVILIGKNKAKLAKKYIFF